MLTLLLACSTPEIPTAAPHAPTPPALPPVPAAAPATASADAPNLLALPHGGGLVSSPVPWTEGDFGGPPTWTDGNPESLQPLFSSPATLVYRLGRPSTIDRLGVSHLPSPHECGPTTATFEVGPALDGPWTAVGAASPGATVPAATPAVGEYVRVTLAAKAGCAEIWFAELFAGGAPQGDVATADFAGEYKGTFPYERVALRQNGALLEGCTPNGTITGAVEGRFALGTEASEAGTGTFQLALVAPDRAVGLAYAQAVDPGSPPTGAPLVLERIGAYPSDDPCKLEKPVETPLERDLADGRALLYGVRFDFDRDTIRSESAPLLDEIAALLAKHADWRLGVEGHTDDKGDDAYNLDLSKRRAAAVVAALQGRGVAADRLASEGFGEARPLADNRTESGRAQNRRVELVTR